MTTALVLAHTTVDIPEAIEFQYADSLTCARFFAKHYKDLSVEQRKSIELSYIRGCFREGLDLTLRQFAKLCRIDTSAASHYLRKFSGKLHDADEKISNALAARAMMNMVEFN